MTPYENHYARVEVLKKQNGNSNSPAQLAMGWAAPRPGHRK